MKLAYFESMDVTLGKGSLSSVLKNSCIHASIQKKRLSQNKLEMASVVLFQVEVFWIFL